MQVGVDGSHRARMRMNKRRYWKCSGSCRPLGWRKGCRRLTVGTCLQRSVTPQRTSMVRTQGRNRPHARIHHCKSSHTLIKSVKWSSKRYTTRMDNIGEYQAPWQWSCRAWAASRVCCRHGAVITSGAGPTHARGADPAPENGC
jgi:hypothetical protein